MLKSGLSTISAAFALCAGLAGIAHAADVGVAIQFSQPGVYGRVDIGQYPQPQLLSPEPVWIERSERSGPPPEPVYLWVPPEHRGHWDRYCHEYHACGRPVYFVHDDWYRHNVVEHHGRRDEGRRDEGRHDEGRREEGRHDEARHDEVRHDDHDRGRGDDNRERARDRE